jgi:hypothetical protein
MSWRAALIVHPPKRQAPCSCGEPSAIRYNGVEYCAACLGAMFERSRTAMTPRKARLQIPRAKREAKR